LIYNIVVVGIVGMRKNTAVVRALNIEVLFNSQLHLNLDQIRAC